jgi:hypothetical protein
MKFLKFLLRKLSKRTNHEYRISEKQLKQINEITELERRQREAAYRREETKELSKEDKEIPNLYVYHESNFSVNIKNIPPMMVQSYHFFDKDKVEFEIILGGECEFDVYNEIKKKRFMHNFDEEKENENVEIELYSISGHNVRIKLGNVKVLTVDAFLKGGYKSEELCKAFILMSYESKHIEKF